MKNQIKRKLSSFKSRLNILLTVIKKQGIRLKVCFLFLNVVEKYLIKSNLLVLTSNAENKRLD